jgi:hypothetical protein
MLWILCQRYNLKANHNSPFHNEQVSNVVDSMSKIQSESKSQRYYGGHIIELGCGFYVKDTI